MVPGALARPWIKVQKEIKPVKTLNLSKNFIEVLNSNPKICQYPVILISKPCDNVLDIEIHVIFNTLKSRIFQEIIPEFVKPVMRSDKCHGVIN